MNPMQTIIVLLALAYFSGGVLKSRLASIQRTKQDAAAFDTVSSLLSELAERVSWVTRHGSSFQFRPQGTIRSVSYDGTIVLNVTPSPVSQRFLCEGWMFFPQKGWRKLSTVSLAPNRFIDEVTRFNVVPYGAKVEMLRRYREKAAEIE